MVKLNENFGNALKFDDADFPILNLFPAESQRKKLNSVSEIFITFYHKRTATTSPIMS